MKKKILVSLLAICLCVISLFGLAGCKDPLSMPNNLDVTSNGGAVVRVGEYLYFTNGFRDVSSLKIGDNRKNIKQGAIYRVKLGENNSLEYDANGNMKGAEKVADNIAGFSSLNLFVYDSYIYYSTPFAEPDKQGNSQFGKTVVKRIKLNGEEDKELYTSSSTSPIKWSVYKIEGKVIIGILDGNKLVSLNVNSNTTKTINNVSSAVFPSVTEYKPNTESTTAGERNVYYVKEDSGKTTKSIYKADLKTLTETPKISATGAGEYTVIDYKTDGSQGELYYALKSGETSYYYGVKVDNSGEMLVSSATTEYTNIKYDQVEFTTLRNGVFAINSVKKGDKTVKEIQLVKGDTYSVVSDHENADITILAVYGEYIYGYNANNQLVKVSAYGEYNDAVIIADFANEKDDDQKEIEDGKEAFYSAGVSSDKSNKNLFVDFDGEYMYFFRTFKNNKGKESVYLARVNVNASKAEVETVGLMEGIHKYIKTDK